MAYTYKGTKITGTNAKAKVFKKSKIKKAKKNQTYLNKSTGHVYKCTHGGKPSEAKWKYTRTDIVAKPSLAVQGLGAPTRSGTKMNAAWNIPADLISNKKGDRATGYNIYWYLGIPGNDPSRVLQVASAGTKTSQVDLNNFWVGKTKYDRKSFYPNTKNKLFYVSVKVAPKNAKGEGGKPTTATRNFEIPRVPSISGFSFNNETGVISVTITTDPGNDYKERYDTRYKMTVTDTRQNKTWSQIDDKTTNTSITLSYNIRNYQELTWDDYVKVTVTAYARGYAGASATASKTAYVSFPQKTTIEDVAVTGKTGQDKCTVLIKTNSTTEHPVDRVRLEYLANCIYDTAESIPSGESWTESDIVDDASCTAMSISVSNLIPERGHYTWVRVVSWHYNENVLYRVSDYMRVTDLETPAATAADDEITILSASPGEDGRSIIVELGWNADGEDDSDGTELSWADEEDTWKSTRTPDSYTFEWSDGPVTVGQITYQDSATITIKDLQEGTRYFIRARRYMEGETTEYSPYSNTSTAITSETPETIVATCDRYVAKGHSLEIYWTFSGNGVQKEWQIVAEDGTVIANGDDSMTTTQISSSRLEALVTNNSLSFTVQASTGGNYVISDLQTVTIVDNPELDITGSSLVHVHEEAEREFSGEIVTFEPDSNETIKSLTATIVPRQSGSGTPSPENIRPISGWESVETSVCGKNLLDPQSKTEYNANTWRWHYTDGYVLKKNVSYNFSWGNKGDNSFNIYLYIQDYETGSNYNAGNNRTSYTPTEDIKVKFQAYYSGGIPADAVFQLELGTTATEYEPYTATTHTTSLGRTVYGGTVDVVKGQLVDNMAIVDLGTLNWSYVTQSGNERFYATIPAKPTSNYTDVANIVCEKYLATSYANVFVHAFDKIISIGTNGYIYLYDSAYTDATELKAAMNGVQLCYELATPTTHTLTPQTINTLAGVNNVWVDSGSVDVVLTETTKDEDQLQTNNLSLEFTSNRLCDLIVIVTSQGAVGQFPAGIRRQTAGDTIHSAVYNPEWTEDNDVFTASINLPTGLDFWDLGRYTVSVVAIDRETGLRSEEASASFAVEWAKQAVDIRPTTTYALSTDTVVDEDKTYYTYDSTTESYLPVEEPVGDEDPSEEGWYEATVTNYITLTPIDEIDDTGYHRQAVQIALIPPPESEETDLYDIYRLTGDGAVLIGESFPLTCTTTDEYAPFGEDMTLNYRVALRTIDGDVSFADFEYVQDSSHLRFDWATGFVEYPYNLSIGDSYKKDVEFRSHLDGGIDGYWNQNVERQAKLSTDLIWIEQQDVIDKTRELARYAGPVYVRTPEGTAYEADVQVTDMSGTDNIIMAVAIDATEVDVTAEFLLPTPYRKEEESE